MKRFEQLFKEQKFTEFITDYESIENKIEDTDKLFLRPMLALAYFHSEDYEKSTQLFAIMCENNKDINLWFNYATSSILDAEFEQGEQAFTHAVELIQSMSQEELVKEQVMPIPFMLMYLTNALDDMDQYDLAFEKLHQLASIYIQVKTTDKQFLYEHGVPAFDDFIYLVANVMSKQTVADTNNWLTTLASHLDEEGAKKLEEVKEKIKA